MAEGLGKIKNNVIKNLKNTYCRIGRSKIEGIGVIAIRDIPKDTNPFQGIREQRWYELKKPDLKKLNKEILKMINDFFVIEKNGKALIPRYGLNGMDISFFLNHSENPNVKRTDNGYIFLTLKKIKKGQELTVSYATYDWKYKK